MAKKRKARARPARKPADQVATSEGRRNTLKLLRNGGIAALALGGAGVFSVNAVRATIAEQDLTRIGNGTPAIVQIHDPTCALCTELQRETRKALRGFERGTVNYLVANIHSEEGGAFARAHGVGHVTLLLLDGQGAVQSVLEGVRRQDELESHFAALLSAG